MVLSRPEIALGLVILSFLTISGAAWVWAIVRWKTNRTLLPPPRRITVPWDGFAILAILLCQVLCSALVGAMHARETGRSGHPTMASASASVPAPGVEKLQTPGLPDPRTVRDALEIQSITNVLLILLVPCLLKLGWSAALADMGFTSRSLGSNLVRGVVGFFLVAPVCYAILVFLNQVLGIVSRPHPAMLSLLHDLTPRTVAVVVLGAVVLAPIAEELVFRGVLLGWLEHLIQGDGDDEFFTGQSEPTSDQSAGNGLRPRGRKRAQGTMPNVVTSFLFAAVHAAQWPAPIPLFVLALALGQLRVRTGSLWAPIILHACFNGFSIVVLLLSLAAGVTPRL